MSLLKSKFILILLALHLLPCSAFAAQDKIEIPADKFSRGVGVVEDTRYFPHGIRLYGLYFPGYAIYEFPISTGHQSIGLEIFFKNPRGQQMDIFVWNYGTRTSDPTLGKENLEANWILWESTSNKGDWQSSRPQYLKLKDGNGIIDFIGKDGILKLLLYADGGYPPDSDELFFIDKIILKFPGYEEILQRVSKMDSVWVEGDNLIAKGFGILGTSKNSAINTANATKAATADGYRNLAKAIYGVEKVGNIEKIEGELKGVTVKDIKSTDKGIEVLLQMPIKQLIVK